VKRNEHGGNALAVAHELGMSACPDIALDFSVNLNPLGPPPALHQLLQQAGPLVTRYPEPYAAESCRSLAAAHGLSPQQVVVGNGSTEIFSWLLQAFRPA
jgi:histidinol-phosphate/aromatic aminotransferase/cobyric acid decarboxylase-like protein